MARTSRRGRDNPGSTPGVVNFLPTSYTKCHKQVRLLVSSTFHRPRDTSLCLIRREPAQPGRLSARLLTLWAWPRALTVAALSVQSQHCLLSEQNGHPTLKHTPHSHQTLTWGARAQDQNIESHASGTYQQAGPCIYWPLGPQERHSAWVLVVVSPHAEGSMRVPNKAMFPHVHRMCLCSVMTLGALCMCVFTSVYFLANPSEGHECVSASPGLSIAWKASVPEAQAGRPGGRGR